MIESKPHRPAFLAVTWAVGSVTVREILREKLLYNVLLITLFLFGVGTLASHLTATHPERIILDFGLASVFFSCSSISILVGSTLLAREIDRRTIHVILSHPISYFQFICGKFSGLAAMILFNWIVLVPCFLGMLHLSNGSTSGALFVALFYALIQAWVLGAIALALSSVFTAGIAIIVSVGLYLLGTNVSQLVWLSGKEQSLLAREGLLLLSRLIPNLEHFSLGTRVTYALEIPSIDVGITGAYACVWIVIALLTAGALLRRKEI